MSAPSNAAIFRNIVQSRRSARRFLPGKPIEKSVIKDVLESTLRSPSSFNLQPTQIMMVQSEEMRNLLSEKAMLGVGNQYRVKDAPAVAVFLADLELAQRIDRVEKLERDSKIRDPNYMNIMPIASSFLTGEGHAATLLKQIATDVLSEVQPMPSIEPVQAWSYKNTALMAQTFCLAATSHGLATSIMEGFDPRRTKEVLRIPDRYGIPLMIATGYDYHKPEEVPKTPRLGLYEVCFGDTFGERIDLGDDREKEVAAGR